MWNDTHRYRAVMALAISGGTLFGLQGAQAQDVFVPSGIEVSFHDAHVEEQTDGETWLTLRLVSPQIGRDDGKVGYEDVADDLDSLCDSHGLPAAAAAGTVDQVLITLMDRIVERGVTDPDATMFIGAYLPAEGGCVWQ